VNGFIYANDVDSALPSLHRLEPCSLTVVGHAVADEHQNLYGTGAWALKEDTASYPAKAQTNP